MKYFDTGINKSFYKFATARSVLLLSSSLTGLFIPIFFYELFNRDLQLVVIYYSLVSLLYVLLLPKTSLLNNIGFKKALQISMYITVLYYVLLYFVENKTVLIIVPLLLITQSVFRLFHWLPYHVDLTKLSDDSNRGRQVSFITSIKFAVAIVGPIFSGIVVDFFGFDYLFITGIVMFLLTSYFFSKIDCIYEEYSWSYKKTWNIFWRNLKDKRLLAFFGDGMESMIGLYVWPVFIYLLLDGDLLEVGILASLITVVVAVLQLLTGKLLDKHKNNSKILTAGTWLYAVGWILKVFVATAFEIFVAGIYHSMTSVFTRTPYEVHMYDHAADQGHYIDEHTVIREMAINVGRAFMGIVVFFVLFVTSVQLLFILAAISVLLLNFIIKSDINLRS